MTARVLPREEYHRLRETPESAFWTAIPESASVVVVERDGAIVARHILAPLVHVECLWKADGMGAGVSRLLWTTVQREARERYGASALVTTATDERITRLLAHVHAEKVPGDAYVIPLEG